MGQILFFLTISDPHGTLPGCSLAELGSLVFNLHTTYGSSILNNVLIESRNNSLKLNSAVLFSG